MDLLLLNDHEEKANNDEWLTLHRNPLCEAHQIAQHNLQREATFRKQQFDCDRHVKPRQASSLPQA